MYSLWSFGIFPRFGEIFGPEKSGNPDPNSVLNNPSFHTVACLCTLAWDFANSF
jgi:hypothetical protein